MPNPFRNDRKESVFFLAVFFFFLKKNLGLFLLLLSTSMRLVL